MTSAEAEAPESGPGRPPPVRLQVIGQRGQLVAQVLRVRQIRRDVQDRRRGRRIDVHEPRLGQRSGVRRAQRPVAVRALVDADARERIPLAEQDPVALWPLVSVDIEGGEPESWPASGHASMTARRPRRSGARSCRRRRTDRGDQRREPPRQHDARRAEQVEQRNQHEAAGGGADQIGGVDDVDPRRQPRDRQRDDQRRR